MRELVAILERQLSQLESEKGLIEGAILEINRRFAVLREVEGWNLLTEPDDAADNTVTGQLSLLPFHLPDLTAPAREHVLIPEYPVSTRLASYRLDLVATAPR